MLFFSALCLNQSTPKNKKTTWSNIEFGYPSSGKLGSHSQVFPIFYDSLVARAQPWVDPKLYCLGLVREPNIVEVCVDCVKTTKSSAKKLPIAPTIWCGAHILSWI